MQKLPIIEKVAAKHFRDAENEMAVVIASPDHDSPKYAMRTISFSLRFSAVSCSTMRPVCST